MINGNSSIAMTLKHRAFLAAHLPRREPRPSKSHHTTMPVTFPSPPCCGSVWKDPSPCLRKKMQKPPRASSALRKAPRGLFLGVGISVHDFKLGRIELQ